MGSTLVRTAVEAAFQGLLEGYGMVKLSRTLSLCELLFLPRFLKGSTEHTRRNSGAGNGSGEKAYFCNNGQTGRYKM